MTNYVRKGANRAAANEKRNRHAQRTPLPPRPGTREDAAIMVGLLDRDGIADALARNLITEEEAATLLARVERRERAAVNGKSKPTAKGKKLAKSVAKKPNAAEGKATSFAEFCVANGWLATVEGADADWTVTAENKSNGERIVLPIINNRVGMPFSDIRWYASDGRSASLRNASAARKQVVGGPGAPVRADARPSLRRNADRTPDRPRTELPFDPDAATEAEIIAAVAGCRITWRNTIAGIYEDERVPAETDPKHKATAVVPHPNGAILQFIALDGRFRAVRLSHMRRVERQK